MSREVDVELIGLPAQEEFWKLNARYKAFVGGLGSGKTFAGACQLLMIKPGARAMVVAPTYPMMRDASQRTFFEICPPQLIVNHNKAEQVTELVGDRIIFWRSAEHPDRLRGPNISDVWLDEAAYMKRSAWDVVIGRLRLQDPHLWLTTTPNGLNWVWEVFERDANDETACVHASTAANKYNDKGYAGSLAKQYKGDPKFASQELEGKFVDIGGSKRLPASLFEETFCQREPIDCPSALGQYQDDIRVYLLAEQGRRYFIGGDPAEGVPKGDDCAATVVDDLGRTCAILAGKYEPKRDFPQAIADLAQFYNDAVALPELNNHGHAVVLGLEDRGVIVLRGMPRRDGKGKTKPGKIGWEQTASSKAELYNTAARVLQDKDCAIYDKRLKAQLTSIERGTLAPADKKTKTAVDDEAISWVLAQWARLNGDTYEEWSW